MSHRRSLPLSAPGMLTLTALLLLATPASAISSPTKQKEACKKPFSGRRGCVIDFPTT